MYIINIILQDENLLNTPTYKEGTNTSFLIHLCTPTQLE